MKSQEISFFLNYFKAIRVVNIEPMVVGVYVYSTMSILPAPAPIECLKNLKTADIF